MLKRKCEASKLTISVVNWLKNLTLLNVRGSCVNQSKTSAFFIALNFNFFTRTELCLFKSSIRFFFRKGAIDLQLNSLMLFLLQYCRVCTLPTDNKNNEILSANNMHVQLVGNLV